MDEISEQRADTNSKLADSYFATRTINPERPRMADTRRSQPND